MKQCSSREVDQMVDKQLFLAQIQIWLQDSDFLSALPQNQKSF
jgi:hypothetical protein